MSKLYQIPSSDQELIDLWLHGQQSIHTRTAYKADILRFLGFIRKPLVSVDIPDIQGYEDSLLDFSWATRARRLAVVRSIYRFGGDTGRLSNNVAQRIRLPKGKDAIAERILIREDTDRMLDAVTDRRNRLLLRLMYASGGRVAEICALKWRDAQPRNDAGQVTLYGKRQKTRRVLLTPATWQELVEFRRNAGYDDPIFVSRAGGHLSRTQVWRIVRKAAREARIGLPASPHWLRHAHASHALDAGAPLSLVQATLGHEDSRMTSRYTHARPSDSSARYLPV